MNIRADKIFLLLIIMITVNEESCILTVLEIRLTRKIYSKSLFVKEKSFCCSSVLVIHSLASQFPAMSNDNICVSGLKGISKAKIDELL